MRIRVETALECSADAAWDAAHRPAIAARLYAPVMRMLPVQGALPERFSSGDRVRVSLRLAGVLPMGSQLIAIEDLAPDGAGARTMRDAGRPLSGPLSLLRSWNHEMTVVGSPRGNALWRDELQITGAFAVVAGPVLWVMWHWRVAKLRRLSRGWGEP